MQGTQYKGIIIDPNKDIQLEVYAYVDFIRNHNKITAAFNNITGNYCSGSIIMFFACPIIWKYKFAIVNLPLLLQE